ncbi:MAG: hypothetical protein ACXVIZ_05715, partial [Halobacteriota archaeon]
VVPSAAIQGMRPSAKSAGSAKINALRASRSVITLSTQRNISGNNTETTNQAGSINKTLVQMAS